MKNKLKDEAKIKEVNLFEGEVCVVFDNNYWWFPDRDNNLVKIIESCARIHSIKKQYFDLEKSIKTK